MKWFKFPEQNSKVTPEWSTTVTVDSHELIDKYQNYLTVLGPVSINQASGTLAVTGNTTVGGTRPLHYTISISPSVNKIKNAISRAANELPYRLILQISAIRFGPDGATHPCYEVVYNNGKIVVFDNIDTFPTEADIARICVECP